MKPIKLLAPLFFSLLCIFRATLFGQTAAKLIIVDTATTKTSQNMPKMPFNIQNPVKMLADLQTGIDSIEVELSLFHTWSSQEEKFQTVYYKNEDQTLSTRLCKSSYLSCKPLEYKLKDSLCLFVQTVTQDTLQQILTSLLTQQYTFTIKELAQTELRDTLHLLQLDDSDKRPWEVTMSRDNAMGSVYFIFHLHNGQSISLSYYECIYLGYVGHSHFSYSYAHIKRILEWLYTYRLGVLLATPSFPSYIIPTNNEVLTEIKFLQLYMKK